MTNKMTSDRWRRRCDTVAFLRGKDGAIAAWFALMLPAFVGIAALAVDMSYSMMMRQKLQISASSAALAAVAGLRDDDGDGFPDDDKFRELAVEYAYLNGKGAGDGTLLEGTCGNYDAGNGQVSGSNDCAQIKPGHFDIVTRTFTAFDAPGYDPDDQPLDAVKVDLRLSEEGNNPVTALFAGIFGWQAFDVNVTATAWAAPVIGNDCINEGLGSANILQTQQDNDFLDGVCLYAKQTLEEGGQNFYDADDGTTITLGLDASIEPNNPNSQNFEEALQDERIDEALLVESLGPIIDAFEFNIENRRFHLEKAHDITDDDYPLYGAPESSDKLPDTLESGKIYIATDTADIKKDMMGSGNPIESVAIIAGKITVESDTVLNNVVLLAKDNFGPDPEVDIGSNVTMDKAMIVSHGDLKVGSNGRYGSGSCASTNVKLFWLAEGRVSIQSNNDISNMVVLGSGDMVDIQSSSSNIFLTTALPDEPAPANDAAPHDDTGYPMLVRPTIQALNELTIQSDNTFTGCPLGPGGGGSSNQLAGRAYRLVN